MSSFQENTVTGVTEKHTLSDVFNQEKKINSLKTANALSTYLQNRFRSSPRNLIPRKPMKQHCSKILPSYAALCLQGVNICIILFYK